MPNRKSVAKRKSSGKTKSVTAFAQKYNYPSNNKYLKSSLKRAKK